MTELPGSVLFACDRNSIRSPMAEAIMKHLVGHRVYVDSAGVQLSGDEPDGFCRCSDARDRPRHLPASPENL